MGDFVLDLRPQAQRESAKAAKLLAFTPRSRSSVLETATWSLVLTSTDRPDLWGPYTSPGGLIVAIAGRIALDESQWQAAESMAGEGGLAAKAVGRIFQESGMEGVERLGGNAALLVYDPEARRLYLMTDAAGAFPVFRVTADHLPVFGSHPDVVAAVAGVAREYDEVSMTEFLLTSTVTPPHTYYRRVKFVDQGTLLTFDLGTRDQVLPPRLRKYFEPSLVADANASEEDLAEELAVAFRRAVQRRTLPRLGRTAVALSGGLDSRAVLASVANPENVFAFCVYNEPNRELLTAQAIAEALRTRFLPWQRDPEYYGRTADQGVRISGGMGTFANNHFLGVLDRLHQEGADNLLTGCYCDYLFKGLPLNRTAHWLTGREQLAPFRQQFYFSHHLRPTPFQKEIRERLESRVPQEFQAQDNPQKILQVEARRTFPLCYEGDNQQRVVPQRVSGWYLPMADRAILDVYCRIPSRYKLNRSVYSKAVRRLCRGAVETVPDANTGARVGAPWTTELITTQWARLKRKMGRFQKKLGTDGSWPDWHQYVRQSKCLADLWGRPNAPAKDFFLRVLSPADVRSRAVDYQGKDTFFFVSLLTLKLWFDQWHGP